MAPERVNGHIEPPTRYLTIEDAASLAGLTEQRLRQLARKGELKWRGSSKDPLFPLPALLALQPEAVPSIPDWVESDTLPVPKRGQGRPPNPPVFAVNTVVRANVLDVLAVMPDASVSAVVCSPPYWGQRIYEDEKAIGWGDGSLVAFGREGTPEQYVAHTLQILKGLLRILQPDGTVWWNIADSYFTRTIARTSSADRIEHYAGKQSRWAGNPNKRSSYGHGYLKDKDLCLIPFQIAVGAQRLGYWVRSVIIWSKQQPVDDTHHYDHERAGANGHVEVDTVSHVHVPEVVGDRPVTSHEYILLLTKSDRYAYDHGRLHHIEPKRNLRTVWTFPPAVWQGTHGARYPDELPRRCILLGSQEGGLIFDPFAGEGTTLKMAKQLRRPYFGCDISKTYVGQARAILKETVVEPVPAEQPTLPEIIELTELPASGQFDTAARV